MFAIRHVSSPLGRARPSFFQRRFVSQPSKPPLRLVAELRKLTDTSISKAREALSATDNDISAALDWLQKDLAVSGAKKAAKVEGREANEGLIGISLLSRGFGEKTGSLRAAMVELNCETDFVGRNDLFGRLLADVAHTAAFMAEQHTDFKDLPLMLRPFAVDALLDAPLLSQSTPTFSPQLTVRSAIRDAIAKLGEKISLRRAVVSVVDNPPFTSPLFNQSQEGMRVASYIHGNTTSPHQGRIGTLTVIKLKSPSLPALISSDAFRGDLEMMERSLARQIVGFNASSISSSEIDIDTALYEQPFMMLAGGPSEDPVKIVLKRWAEDRSMCDNSAPTATSGIEVCEFAKWTVGEHIEPGEVWVVSDILSKINPSSFKHSEMTL